MRYLPGLPAVLLLVGAAACSGKGDPIEPPLGEGGKSDVVDRVEVVGPLELGGEVAGEFTEDLQFFGYTLDVASDSHVKLEVSHTGTSSSLDATLFVYGPERDGGGYGSVALATNDDSGWGDNPRLADVWLEAGGRYLVVVGTHDGTSRGRYRATAECTNGDCSPSSEVTECHPAIADDIRACVEDLLSDPDNFTTPRADAIAQCADAEPAADAFDEVCAAASPPPFCAAGFESFAVEYLPMCARELVDEALDQTCVFGTTFHELRTTSWLSVTREEKITAVAGLTALEREQVVLAVRASSHEPETAQEALDAVDQNEINQLTVWDATGRRAFTVYEYGAGDNSYGRYFAAGTTDTVGLIHDGDLGDCTVMLGDELRDCRFTGDCRGTLECVGQSIELQRGSCVDVAADDAPEEGDACGAAATDACPGDEGLICGGLTQGAEGVCVPAWQKRRFDTRADQAVPDDAPAGASSQLVVYGTAGSMLDVSIAVRLEHPRVADLKLTLTNPTGATVPVPFDPAEAFGGVLELDQVVEGFPLGIAMVGSWTLTAVDEADGKVGKLDRWSLTVTTRD